MSELSDAERRYKYDLEQIERGFKEEISRLREQLNSKTRILKVIQRCAQYDEDLEIKHVQETSNGIVVIVD